MEKIRNKCTNHIDVIVFPLHSIEVHVSKAGYFYRLQAFVSLGAENLQKVLHSTRRSLHVYRTVVQGGSVETVAKETYRYNHEDETIPPWLEAIFRRLWPMSSEKWQNDWYSFPLHLLRTRNL